MFLQNLLLALAWVFLTGKFDIANFFFGLAVCYVMLSFSGQARKAHYLRKLPTICYALAFFVWEFVKANLKVAWDVLTPTDYMQPAVLAIPLDLESDAEIALLANMITLTPGTLSLDVSTDRKVLYIHAMYVDDPEQARREIKDGFERIVREVFE